jgi:hypothetical protein
MHRSPEYRAAVQAVVAADNAFVEASIKEIQRLMPDGVRLLFEINDTPRLTFSGFVSRGEEYDGEDIDTLFVADGLYDALDEVAMQLGWRDWEDADAWLMRHDESRFYIESEVTS